jgi:hypothetical protein
MDWWRREVDGGPIRDGMQGMSLRGHTESGGSKLGARVAEGGSWSL